MIELSLTKEEFEYLELILHNHEYEENENEAKRRIKILQPQFLDAAISDMKRIMKYSKSSTFINSKLKGMYNPRLSGS